MRAISLWQPWASLWLTTAKVHETRHWPTSYRGWLVVQAAKRKIDDFSGDRLDEICDGEFGNHWGMDIPRGALIGMVDLVDCRQMKFTAPEHEDDRSCGDWQPERYAWRRGKYVLFPEPIPYRGQQGMFDVPDALLPERAAA